MGMIQIRNVPPELHLKLKAKAAKAGMSLSDYLLRDAERSLQTLTMEEFRERAAKLSKVELTESPAEIIRQMRGPI